MSRWNREKWYYLDPPARGATTRQRRYGRYSERKDFRAITVQRYGFNYINLKLKTSVPGVLLATHLSNISTGMTALAQRKN